MLGETKKFLDTNIFRSFNILHGLFATYFVNFNVAFKNSIGIKIDNQIIECIEYMANSYNSLKNIDKIEYANKCLILLYNLEINFKLLKDSYRCISTDQYTAICKECAHIELQLKKWTNKLMLS